MPIISLPDNSKRVYDAPITSAQVAADIGAGLAKATIAGRANKTLIDASDTIDKDVSLEIVTIKDQDGLDIIRHSCAHLFGHALKQLFPNHQMVIGPVIEDGFYYDIYGSETLHPEDLQKIEERMKQLAATKYPVVKKMTPRAEAKEIFRQRGEEYKVRLIDDMADDVTSVGLYYHEEYVDMCRGPHVPHMGHIKSNAFALTRLAGAYWRGDANNEMLQRVYGTCWQNSEALKLYMERIEEAKKRDHRLLGHKLDLFHLQEEAPGMVFWHPKGAKLFSIIEEYLREKLIQTGFQEIRTPLIMDVSLWKKSGHWDKFREDMFTSHSEKREYAIKPMNCPGHLQIYNQELRSYRDLPFRLAEFGLVHRNEASGTLHGIMRVRSFTQDDSHILCTEEQIESEVQKNCSIIIDIYKYFGFSDISISLSTRPEKRIGSDDVWDKSEAALAQALKGLGLKWQVSEGEGAFYGPKLEFSLTDAIGRIWQCGTIQVDFSMPERLSASYINEDGDRATPVLIHRAVIGSLERFIGVLIEHYEGFLPVWLAPVQVVILTITEKHADYANELKEQLINRGVRVESDLRNEKVSYKIRQHSMQRIPFLAIVGDKESADKKIAIRDSSGEDRGSCSIDELVAMLKQAQA